MRGVYCEICDKRICSENKSKQLTSKSHIETSKGKHVKFSLKDLNIDEIDEIYKLHLIEHDKKYDFLN